VDRATKIRMSHIVIGVALLLVAILLIAMGLSFLPVIGVLIALPLIYLAGREFRARRARQQGQETESGHEPGARP
jgi:Flp pilus assembly protein TadB